MSAVGVLEEFCARNSLVLGAELSGGSLSCVHEAFTSAGTKVVVKTADECVASEAQWLSRHPSTPQVLEVDADDAVLVLEFIEGSLLVDDVPPLDVAAEISWLHMAARAAGPSLPGVVDVRDRYRHAFEQVTSRPNARVFDVDAAEQWLAWVGALDSSAWQSVGMDVMFKNTLVDTAGRWWAFDPMCSLAPDAAGWCPWILDRTAKTSNARSLAAVVADQDALVAAAPDPEATAAWMPGAVLWKMRWSPMSKLSHELYLSLFDVWASRWRSR